MNLYEHGTRYEKERYKTDLLINLLQSCVSFLYWLYHTTKWLPNPIPETFNKHELCPSTF